MTTEVHFNQIENKIIKSLNEAKLSVDIAVAWITSPKIIDEIKHCLIRRVKIRLISVQDNINNIEVFTSLYYSGAEVRLLSKKLMHNKFCIIDNRIIISGSYNWTIKAATNHENVTIVNDNYDLTKTFFNEFEQIWRKGSDISKLIPINKTDLDDLEYDFSYYLDRITWNCKLPFIYFISETLKPNQHHFPINTRGHIQNGFYLIKEKYEAYDFFRYIFYSKCNYPFNKISSLLKIPNQLIGLKLSNVLTSQELTEDTVITIKENLWVELHDYESKPNYNFITQINLNGDFSDLKYLVKSNYKNSYILLIKDVYQIFTINGGFKDFNYLNNQIPSFRLSPHRFIDEENFISDVLIDNENKISKVAIFNINGKMISDPIFYRSDFENKNENVVLSEIPVLFINNFGSISTIHNERGLGTYSSKKKWRFQNKKLYHDNIVQYDTTALYTSDEDFGPLYLTISILKSKWAVKYFEMAKLQYQKTKIKEIEVFYDKILISKKIVQEIEKQEKWDLERIIHQNKLLEKKKVPDSDYCFIATAIYGDLNHPKTVDFRIFRELYLKNNLFGKIFIRFYYRFSPYYVQLMKKSKLLIFLTRNTLTIIHYIIK